MNQARAAALRPPRPPRPAPQAMEAARRAIGAARPDIAMNEAADAALRARQAELEKDPDWVHQHKRAYEAKHGPPPGQAPAPRPPPDAPHIPYDAKEPGGNRRK